MSYTAIILIALLFLVLVGVIILLIFKIRKKKNSKNLEFESVLKDFEEAERRFAQYGGQTEPHNILYEIAKSKRTAAGSSGPEVAGIRIGKIRQQPNGGESIQNYSSPVITAVSTGNQGSKGGNRKGLFRRRRVI